MRRELWVLQVDVPDDFDSTDVRDLMATALPQIQAVHGYAIALPIPDTPPKQSDFEEVN